MKTINKKLADRLNLQLNEAKLQGLDKIASNIEHVVKTAIVRKSDEEYTYSSEDLGKDVSEALWTGVVRAADFYDCNIDAVAMEKAIAHFASQLIEEVRVQGGVVHGVGTFEPKVAGEADLPVVSVEDE